MQEPRLVYANYVQARGGGFDVALEFGHRFDPEEVPEPDVRVVMSWEHLSTLVPILERMLRDYQNQLGDLPRVSEPQQESTP